MNASADPHPNMRGERLRLGLTLNQLAAQCKKAGVPVSASELCRIEGNIHAPRPRLRKVLAGVLGMSTDDFPVTGNWKNPVAGKPVTENPGPAMGGAGVREPAKRVSAEDHVNWLGLEPGTERALTSAGVKFAADVARLVEQGDLTRVRGIGMFQLEEIERVLYETGLSATLRPCLTGEHHPVTEICLVRCLGLSTRPFRALTGAEVNTVAEAVELVKTGEIRFIRGLGQKCCEELRTALAKAGLRWG